MIVIDKVCNRSVPGMAFSCIIENNCVVDSLFIQPFSGRIFTDKFNIISRGIPTIFNVKKKNLYIHLKKNNILK